MNSLRKINRNSNFNRFSVSDNNFCHNLFVSVSQSINLHNWRIASSQPTFTKQNSSRHYENTPMYNTAIFHGCKNNNFQMKNCDVFLIFAKNIDCG